MTVAPFRRDGKFTDIRVAIRDLLDRIPNAKDGIIMLLDEENDMHIVHVCKSRDLAYAAAVMLQDAVEESVDE